MKLTAVLTIRMKKGILPQFISTLYKQQMEISSINLTESDSKFDGYTIEIIYTSKKDLMRVTEALKKNSEMFRDISITSTLEDKIVGGLLVTEGKIQIETVSDIETAFLGGTTLIHEKIDAGFGKQYCSVSDSIGVISAFKKMQEPTNEYYHYYADSERDSIIISRFTDKNAYPVALKYQSVEDLIKILKGLEESFSCFRFMNTDSDDHLFRNTIIDAVKKPVLFRETDELPLYLMSVITKTCKKQRNKPEETSVGILGLNHGMIRLTSLLSSAGYLKVLGHDQRERTMMSFESEGGLATTAANVADNADILIATDDQLLRENIPSINPGGTLIAGFGGETPDPAIIAERGLKELIRFRTEDLLTLIPPMVKGITSGEQRFFSNELLIKISQSTARELSDDYRFPGFFSEVSEKIESGITRG
ncbi:MAG TPA: hypothetical protein PK358_00025 [Spirochaetota bacterium]|nr:hypothetical protein [Spirochaetota bacterium]HPJ33187.1 hypothetical protein [Spirochaetota bacterium]